MSGRTAARSNDDEVLEVTTHVDPLSEEDSDLRERQLAVIMRMLRRAAEAKQSEGASKH
jgi:hypothetical protein